MRSKNMFFNTWIWLIHNFSPDREQPAETCGEIRYTILQEEHLDQVHVLLESTFWLGINSKEQLVHP